MLPGSHRWRPIRRVPVPTRTAHRVRSIRRPPFANRPAIPQPAVPGDASPCPRSARSARDLGPRAPAVPGRRASRGAQRHAPSGRRPARRGRGPLHAVRGCPSDSCRTARSVDAWAVDAYSALPISAVHLHQSHRFRGRLGRSPGIDAELGQNGRDVMVNRPGREEQPRGDLESAGTS